VHQFVTRRLEQFLIGDGSDEIKVRRAVVEVLITRKCSCGEDAVGYSITVMVMQQWNGSEEIG
ncbi:hypothetical protein M8C21_006261, partial [Ambrosia artemisiifolia]